MRIFICGDSTCCKFSEIHRPLYGWGEFLDTYLPDTEVFNKAEGGKSSKSFLEEGDLQNVLDQLLPGDLMLIQLGGNDFPTWSGFENRHTEPHTEYPRYLSRYIEGARERGALPVLLTSAWLRRYTMDNKPIDILHEYNDAVRSLAVRENVPLIDVVSEAIRKLGTLPREETMTYFAVLLPGTHKNFPNGKDDNNHSLRKGAMFNAQIVAEGLKKLGLV